MERDGNADHRNMPMDTMNGRAWSLRSRCFSLGGPNKPTGMSVLTSPHGLKADIEKSHLEQAEFSQRASALTMKKTPAVATGWDLVRVRTHTRTGALGTGAW